MKELLNEWKEFLLTQGNSEEEIKQHNLDIIFKIELSESLEDFLKEAIENKRIKALINNKILQNMGSGVSGTALKISNDHVLKVYGRGEENTEFGQRVDNLDFDELLGPQDLMIYESGEFGDYAWRELPLIITLENWIFQTRGSEVDMVQFNRMFDNTVSLPLEAISENYDINQRKGDIILRALSSKDLSLKSYLRILKALKLNEGSSYLNEKEQEKYKQEFKRQLVSVFSILGEEELRGLILAFVTIMKSCLSIIDSHSGNIGIIPSTRQFVIFDN